MNRITPIKEWERIFFDASFLIECLLDPDVHNGYKKLSIERSQKLLEHIIDRDEKEKRKTRWVTSSIVLSELNKLQDIQHDSLEAIQSILNTPEVEIINFTKREAQIILKDFPSFIETKHYNSFIKELEKAAAKNDIFNPKCVISNDALICACAKAKFCDVVLTSDKNTFYTLASKVNLPVLLCADIPVDMYGDIDSDSNMAIKGLSLLE